MKRSKKTAKKCYSRFKRLHILLNLLLGNQWLPTMYLVQEYMYLFRARRPSELSVRRLLHRDLRGLISEGMLIEHRAGGAWRLRQKDYKEWIGGVVWK